MRRVKVLGLAGSPRDKGISSALLKSALSGARSKGASTERITLNNLKIRPCQECGGCSRTGKCVIPDDMRPVYSKLEAADAVIVASPVFFGSVTAPLKAMIDRLHAVWMAKYLLKKGPLLKRRRGVFFCTAGKDDKRYLRNSREIISIFFRMFDIEYKGELYLTGLNKLTEDSPKVKAALKKAFDIGVSLAKP